MRLGIVGGGQLARMLALAARPLGVECVVVEPAGDPPSACVAQLVAQPYDHPDALEALASCDAVTVELEEVPVAALARLDGRVPVRPAASTIAITQDRLFEKQLLRALGIPTAPFDGEVAGAPAIVKARRGGFDGRGNRLCRTDAELSVARADLAPAVVEGLVPFSRELSVLAARGVDGAVRCWPVVENVHDRGILRRTIAPAPGLTPALQAEAEALATSVLADLDYVGVLAVELFQVGDHLLANELAPRVHNSGHWTIDGAVTSQFEQHVRAVLGLPLGDPSARGTSVLLNMVGGIADPAAVLAVPGAHLHRYGKAPRPGRKVGHVTLSPCDGPDDPRVAALDRVVPFDV